MKQGITLRNYRKNGNSGNVLECDLPHDYCKIVVLHSVKIHVSFCMYVYRTKSHESNVRYLNLTCRGIFTLFYDG